MKGHYHIGWLTIYMLIIIVACSPQNTHKVLNIFFDGVPPQKNDETMANLSIDSLGMSNTSKGETLVNVMPSAMFIHLPYQKKECSSCHSEIHMGKLVLEQPQLCFGCHENTDQEAHVIHGPVRAGQCTSCHKPHKSDKEYLLINTNDDLCFECHQPVELELSIVHNNVKKGNKCVECHNPHSSESAYLLKPKACFNCHDEIIKDYSFLHGPVSGNYCSTCHVSHDVGGKSLLVAQSPQLCTGCHSESTLYLNPKHHVENRESCLECHNPHGGENQFMLN